MKWKDFFQLSANALVVIIFPTKEDCNHIRIEHFKLSFFFYLKKLDYYSFSRVCSLMVGSLINEPVYEGAINFYDSSQCLCAFGVYSGRGGTTARDPEQSRGKQLEWWTYSASPLGGNCFSYPLYDNSCAHVFVTRIHINAQGLDIFSICDTAQRANRIRKSFSFFLAVHIYICIVLTLFFAPFYFSL